MAINSNVSWFVVLFYSATAWGMIQIIIIVVIVVVIVVVVAITLIIIQHPIVTRLLLRIQQQFTAIVFVTFQ